jgi:hypothetical protein
VKTSHSADVRIHLYLNGAGFRVAQLGPDSLILETPIDHPPAEGELVVQVDHDMRRWPIYLAEGIQSGRRHVPISRYLAALLRNRRNVQKTSFEADHCANLAILRSGRSRFLTYCRLGCYVARPLRRPALRVCAVVAENGTKPSPDSNALQSRVSHPIFLPSDKPADQNDSRFSF